LRTDRHYPDRRSSDEDPRGEYHLIGQAQTANFAASFFSLGQATILQSQSQIQVKLGAADALSRMLSTVAFGQYLDCQSPQAEPAYWQVVETKSASFFAAALQLGAWFGGAPETVVGNIGQFGGLYGAMIQIYDDLNDSLDEPANPDWLQNRSPLPILFAQSVGHPDRTRFLELRRDVSDGRPCVKRKTSLSVVAQLVIVLTSCYVDIESRVKFWPIRCLRSRKLSIASWTNSWLQCKDSLSRWDNRPCHEIPKK
jgi:hypothetical protein